MKILKHLFIFLMPFNIINAQCKAIIPFTERDMEQITDVYQFTFLHKNPQNKLDSLVIQAMYPTMIIDSNYYDWNSNFPRMVSRIDLYNFRKIVDDIGKLQTKEAFLILNLGYMLPFKTQGDLSPFTTFCNNLNYYGATDAINKYYLQDSISYNLSRSTFDNEVLAKALPMRKQLFKDIKYCQALTGNDRYLYEMQLHNSSYYDSVIERIVSKYLNHYPNLPGYFELDSVMLEILQLPFVHDAQWDNCVVKVADENHVPPYQLGVIIVVDKDAYKQNIYIQRVYAVAKDSKRYSYLLPTKYDVDFVGRTRRQCEGEYEEMELK